MAEGAAAGSGSMPGARAGRVEGGTMKTLEDLVLEQVAVELCGSGDNSPEACKAYLDAVSNVELLQRLSWAMEKLQGLG